MFAYNNSFFNIKQSFPNDVLFCRCLAKLQAIHELEWLKLLNNSADTQMTESFLWTGSVTLTDSFGMVNIHQNGRVTKI